jgi:ankyrin repeat protein
MDYHHKIITDFELQSVSGIRECFENGVHPNDTIHGKPLINELINMYSRGPLFRECVRVFVDYGLDFPDKVLLSVLLNDATSLETQLAADRQPLQNKYSFKCAFTPLHEVSLLHICAEYNHLACAKILVQYGADINARAGVDENGFGEHTPIFHTVNQHNNLCIETMKYLLTQKADLSITVKGLVWGKGYDWETFIPSVNPISYAMMGLLRQFQRTEKQIYEIVSLLIKAAYGIDYTASNIPNKYLQG